MKKRGLRLITMITMICLIVTITAPGAFADDSLADAYDRLVHMLILVF